MFTTSGNSGWITRPFDKERNEKFGLSVLLTVYLGFERIIWLSQ